MNDFYVYTYSDPDTGIPFYVGKGCGDRALIHLTPTRLKGNTHFYCRLRAMLGCDQFPKIQYVKLCVSEQDAVELEVSLIAKYGRLDNGTGVLCNHTDGGEGHSGRTHSLKTKERMQDAATYRATPVESFDLRTGNTVMQYDSIKAAARAGFSRQCVANVIHERQKSHKGLGWRESTTLRAAG